jgi:hypothetical protein
VGGLLISIATGDSGEGHRAEGGGRRPRARERERRTKEIKSWERRAIIYMII